jgi:hypothetical protein
MFSDAAVGMIGGIAAVSFAMEVQRTGKFEKWISAKR